MAKGRNASGSEQCDHFASWTKAGKSEEMESRPPPVAEEGRRRALSKREDFDREGERRPFCKLDRWFESNRGSQKRDVENGVSFVFRKKQPTTLRFRRGPKPTAAGGGRREAKGAWQKGEMRAGASSATILQAGPLVRVQQGEPRRSKVRFAPILFFRKKTKPSARCLAPPRFAKNARRFLREQQRDQRHCGSAVGPKPTAAGGGGREAKGA